MLIRKHIIELNLRIIIILVTWAAIVSYSIYFDLFAGLFIFLNLDFEMILFSKELPLLLQEQTKFIVEDDLIYYSQTYKNITLTNEVKIVAYFTYFYVVPYLIQTQLLLFYKNVSYENHYKNIKLQMQFFFLLYYAIILNITELVYFDFIEENILDINEINPQLEYINFENFQTTLFEMLSSCQIFFITQVIGYFSNNETIMLSSNAITNITFYVAVIEQLLTDDIKNIYIATIYYIIRDIFFIYTIITILINQLILVRKEGFEPSIVKHK